MGGGEGRKSSLKDLAGELVNLVLGSLSKVGWKNASEESSKKDCLARSSLKGLGEKLLSSSE